MSHENPQACGTHNPEYQQKPYLVRARYPTSYHSGDVVISVYFDDIKHAELRYRSWVDNQKDEPGSSVVLTHNGNVIKSWYHPVAANCEAVKANCEAVKAEPKQEPEPKNYTVRDYDATVRGGVGVLRTFGKLSYGDAMELAHDCTEATGNSPGWVEVVGPEGKQVYFWRSEQPVEKVADTQYDLI